MKITQNLIDLIYEFAECDDELVEPSKTRYEFLSKALGYLKSRLTKFPESIQAVQQCLFDTLLYRLAESNISSDRIYQLINNDIFSLLDFEYMFNHNGDEFQKKLVRVLELFISNDVLDAIQPESVGKALSRVRYYQSMFSKLGLALKDIKTSLRADLVDKLLVILNQVEQIDAYQSLFDAKTFTINYNILQPLSWYMTNPNADERVVVCLIKIWGNLFGKDIEEFNRSFYTLMCLAAQFHGKLVAMLAPQIFDFYLTSDTSQLISIILVF